MKKRTIVIGDIHGGYKALTQLLDRVQITTEDTLILLGDLVDGWSESYEVVEYLFTLQKTHGCIFIKGNHDLYCEYWLATGESNLNWEQHGGKATMASYADKSQSDKDRHRKFFSVCLTIISMTRIDCLYMQDSHLYTDQRKNSMNPIIYGIALY